MKKKITVIGTDSTHCIAFAKLLKNPSYHFEWEITHALIDARSKLEISRSRVDMITQRMEDECGIQIMERVNEEVMEQTDAFLIASVDGSLHYSQLQEIIKYKKPVFIDKPLTYSVMEAKKIFTLTERNNVPIFSSSSLRFSKSVRHAEKNGEKIIKDIALRGPMPMETGIPGLFWYGIHLVEMLHTLCKECLQVTTVHQETTHLIIEGKSKRHKIPFQLVGDTVTNSNFSGVLTTTNRDQIIIDISQDEEPLYFYLVKEMIEFFDTGIAPVTANETIAVLDFIEQVHQKM